MGVGRALLVAGASLSTLGVGDAAIDPRLTPTKVMLEPCDGAWQPRSHASEPWLCRGGAGAVRSELSTYHALMEEAREYGDLGFAAFGGESGNDSKRLLVYSGYRLSDDMEPEQRGVATVSIEQTSWLWPEEQQPALAREDAIVGRGALWMATAGVSYALHFDQLTRAPWRQGFFLLQLVGRKTVRLAAPGDWPLLHLHPWCHEAGLDTQLPDLKGDLTPWASLQGRFDLLNTSQASELGRVLHVAELSPGDVLYIPPAWFHETDADTDGVSLRVLPTLGGEESELEALHHMSIAEVAAKKLEKVSCSACSFLVDLLPRALGAQRARCSAALVLASMYVPASRGEGCGEGDHREYTDYGLGGGCSPCRNDAAGKVLRTTLQWLRLVQESSRGLATVALAETIIYEMVGDNITTLELAWELLLTHFGFEGSEEDQRKLEQDCVASEMELVRSAAAEASGEATSARADL